MNINSLIQAKNQNPTEKVASQNESLDSLLARAEQNIQQEKVASEQNNQVNEPAAHLKTAAVQYAQRNREEEERHARKLGFCMSEGFIAGVSAYEKAAEQLSQEKVASSNDLSPDEINLIKNLRSNPDEFVEKIAAIQVEKEFNETVRSIHKTASDHYLTGYAATQQLINEQNNVR